MSNKEKYFNRIISEMLSKTYLTYVEGYQGETHEYYFFNFLYDDGELVHTSYLDPEEDNFIVRELSDYLHGKCGVRLKDCYSVYKVFCDRLDKRTKKDLQPL